MVYKVWIVQFPIDFHIIVRCCLPKGWKVNRVDDVDVEAGSGCWLVAVCSDEFVVCMREENQADIK